MEMKYIREQDTGQIYLPYVHVSGIVGLDINGMSTKSKKEISLIDSTDLLIIDGSIRFVEYNKLVYSDISIELDYNSDNESSLYRRLLKGFPVTIEIDTKTLRDYSYLVYDTVSYNDLNVISSLMDVGLTYSSGVITINASLKNNNYSFDDLGILHNETTDLKLTKIIGSAYGMII